MVRKRIFRTIVSLWIGGFIAALALLFCASSGLAATDQDNDGLEDEVEFKGCAANQSVPLPAPLYPMPVGPEVEKFYPNCPGSNGLGSVAKDVRDVFVIYNDQPDPVSPQPPVQPDAWLGFIANTQQPLKMNVHRVTRDPSVNCKCVLAPPGGGSCSDTLCTQKALRIQEDNVSGLKVSNILGSTPWQGVPNTAGDISVFTQRIAEDIAATCKGKTCTFKDENNTERQLTEPGQWGYLYRSMKLFVIGHESGHTMMLRAVATPDLGYHYPEGKGWLMDACVARKSSGKVVTWVIPYRHGPDDDPKLKATN